jgi:hypothetical protein
MREKFRIDPNFKEEIVSDQFNYFYLTIPITDA